MEMCGYCGQDNGEPLNRYGVHENCLHEVETENEGNWFAPDKNTHFSLNAGGDAHVNR